MLIACLDCGQKYNDARRWTTCPHPRLEDACPKAPADPTAVTVDVPVPPEVHAELTPTPLPTDPSCGRAVAEIDKTIELLESVKRALDAGDFLAAEALIIATHLPRGDAETLVRKCAQNVGKELSERYRGKRG
jgi:hypothetical protein